MVPTEILKTEHRAIERVLRILEVASQRLESEAAFDLSILEKILDFIRNFADRCHYHKEEDRLFPLLYERGLPREGGPIAVMLEEHDIGRGYVRDMREALEKLKQGEKAQRKIFTANANAFTQLLFAHIQKEDNILYPIGEEVLMDEDREKLIAAFEEIEEKEMGEGVHEQYHQMIEDLEKELRIE